MSESDRQSRKKMEYFGTIARLLAGFTLLSVFQVWNGPGTKVEVIFKVHMGQFRTNSKVYIYDLGEWVQNGRNARPAGPSVLNLHLLRVSFLDFYKYW